MKAATVATLKFWDQRYPDILMDSKYVKTLMLDVFGSECLAKSSVGGNWARNAPVKHDALDAIKLEFLRGNLTRILLSTPNFIPIRLSSHYTVLTTFTEIFMYRVGSDVRRSNKFTEIVNKHCNYFRRPKNN